MDKSSETAGPHPDADAGKSTPARDGLREPGGLASLPPTWGLLPFAAVALAAAGAVEALLLGTAPLAQVWPIHLVLVSASGLAVALPVYYHVSRYKRASESALEDREATLARMNEYIINASDNFPHGMAIFDRERSLVFSNRAMRERFPESRRMVCPGLAGDGAGGGCAECLVPLVLGDRQARTQRARFGPKDVLIHGSWIRSPGGEGVRDGGLHRRDRVGAHAEGGR